MRYWPVSTMHECEIVHDSAQLKNFTQPAVKLNQDEGALVSRYNKKARPWGRLSYADLICKAIESSPDKRMRLNEIYSWIAANVPYFADKQCPNSSFGWKNSIRHNLSLHKCFVRVLDVDRSLTPQSSYWEINRSCFRDGERLKHMRRTPYRIVKQLVNINKSKKAKALISNARAVQRGMRKERALYTHWIPVEKRRRHGVDQFEAANVTCDKNCSNDECMYATGDHNAANYTTGGPLNYLHYSPSDAQFNTAHLSPWGQQNKLESNDPDVSVASSPEIDVLIVSPQPRSPEIILYEMVSNGMNRKVRFIEQLYIQTRVLMCPYCGFSSKNYMSLEAHACRKSVIMFAMRRF